MKGFMRFLWLLSGILLIICGAAFMLAPGATLSSISLYIGIGVLLSGISGCAAYFTERRHYPGSGWLLCEAILDVVLGVLLLSSGGWQLVALLLPAMFSVWVIVKGFVGVIDAIESRYYPGSRWVIALAAAVVCVLLGIASFMYPAISAFAIALVCGCGLIAAGAAIIVMWFKLRRIRKSAKGWRERIVQDEAGFARDYPVAYLLMTKRMIDAEFEDEEA